MDTHERPEDRVGTASRPSRRRITDLRTATVGWDRWHFTLVRVDTDQGPGLGFGPNLDAVEAQMVPWDCGLFAPTPEWDGARTRDRLWS